MPISTGCRARANSPSSASRTSPPGAVTLLEWPDRAAGLLPADRLDIALTLSPQQGPTFRHARVTGYGSFAARAERIAADPPFLSTLRLRRRPSARTHAGRRLDPRLRAAHARRRELHPDEFAAAAGWAAGARRQALQRNRASGRKRDAVHRHGAGACASAGFRRRRFLPPTATPACWCIEDLGDELVVEGDPPAPIEARYEAAVDLLAALHRAAAAGRAAGRAGRRLRTAALRHGGVADRSRAAARLVSAAARRASLPIPSATPIVALWRDALLPVIEARADLGAARFSFAQSAVAAGARGRRAHRPARFPGRGDGARRPMISLRCCRTRASTCRR